MKNRLINSIFIIIIFGAAFQVYGQIKGETEIPVLKNFSLSTYRCSLAENIVVTKELFGKMRSTKGCSYPTEMLKVNFDKQTIISYVVQGDCRVAVKARVFRNDEEKKYIVRFKKIWGGCRSAGTLQSWSIIEKIPSDYNVEFSEIKVED